MAAAVFLNAFTHSMNPIVDVVIRTLSYVLVPMFFFGMAGAAVVVAITVVQDVIEFSSPDEEVEKVSPAA